MQDKTYQQSEVDLAYQILHSAGKAMYFRDLISKVLEVKGDPVHSPAYMMAEIHTQINRDSRFVHTGKNNWGLSEWVPQKNSRYTEDSGTSHVESKIRRERLLEEIQQDYAAAASEPDENDEPS